MDAEAPHRERRLAWALGLGLIALGLLCNEWLLPKAFSISATIKSPAKRTAVRIVDLSLVAIGVAAIVLRNRLGLAQRGRRFAQLRPKLCALLIGILAAGFLFLSVEAAFRALVVHRERQIAIVEECDRVYWLFDKTLGYRPQPGATVRATRRTGTILEYDVVYTIDPHGRRVVPEPEPGVAPDKFLLFFGGSFAFGDGVKDNETLPCRVSELAPAHHVYNFAFSGYGTQHMLVQLRDLPAAEQIRESQGFLVYVFNPAHVRRVIGSMRVVTQWGRHMPYFVIDEQGEVLRRGSFASALPGRLWFYQVAAREPISWYFMLDLPLRITDAHLTLTTRLIEASRAAFERLFEGSKFYVLLYPCPRALVAESRRLVPFLEQANIPVIDCADTVYLDDPGYSFAVDEHPTAKTHRIVAHNLVEELGIGESAE